ncbi:MAG: hypothetical protein JM58_05635 [Peptococcaceae bacterium BICA1-8]|nr:MAG: hypothetical protein JM58_05635 [Peptococcaceae bacterium BICA1-8]
MNCLKFSLGIEEQGIVECDYAFPVGNVKRRKENEVTPNQVVDLAIQNARKIISTTLFLGTYHSHPYEKIFKEWDGPSNADISFSLKQKEPYMIIIALTRNEKGKQPLFIEYLSSKGYRYSCIEDAKDHDWPKEEKLDKEVQYISGEFDKFIFEIRAYKVQENCLCSIGIFSSEVELLTNLISEEIEFEKLEQRQVYNLRKLEFNFRLINQFNRFDRSNENTEYHIKQLKNIFSDDK